MENKNMILADIPYGDHERHRVDIYIPHSPKSSNGLILFIHGGGWSDGDKTDHHADAEYLCQQGYVCASVNYRFVSESLTVSDELDDITAALAAIKQKCAEHGLFPKQLIYVGVSAGAHLSLLHAYTRKDESPLTAVAACMYCPPVYCYKGDFLSGKFEDWKYEILSKCCGLKITKESYFSTEAQEALKKISPAELVSDSTIPTALLHGAYDEIIPLDHAKSFLAFLENKGIKTELLIYPNSTHALDKDPEQKIAARNIIQKHAETYFQE